MLNVLKKDFLWIMLIIMIIIGIIATVCIFHFSESCNQAGTIGDTLSGVFTSLAFICAIIAIILQSNELSLQRKELEATRTELENQKKEFQIQNQTLKRQQFENTFFKLFSLFMEIRDKVGIIEHNQNVRGVKCFYDIFLHHSIDIHKADVDNAFFQKLISLNYRLCNGGNTVMVSGNFKDILKKIGIEFYKFKSIYYSTVLQFTSYYKHLFNTIKFVDDSNNIEDSEKQEYVNYLVDILSQDEMLVTFCIAYNDNNMKILIEKYHIFKNLLNDTLPDINWKKMYYNDSAFICE